MVLYKNYCYSDIYVVASALRSEVFIDGLGLVYSVVPLNASRLRLQVQRVDGSLLTSSLTFSTCHNLGFNSSYSGLTLDDSVELAWLCVSCLAVAYGFKLLRRAF